MCNLKILQENREQVSKYKFQGLTIAALITGLLISWIDSRPNWDDTAIIVVMVFAGSAIFGFIIPSRAWIWAVAVGIWIPLFNIILTQNYGSILALVIAFAGSYAGAFFRKQF